MRSYGRTLRRAFRPPAGPGRPLLGDDGLLGEGQRPGLLLDELPDAGGQPFRIERLLEDPVIFRSGQPRNVQGLECPPEENEGDPTEVLPAPRSRPTSKASRPGRDVLRRMASGRTSGDRSRRSAPSSNGNSRNSGSGKASWTVLWTETLGSATMILYATSILRKPSELQENNQFNLPFSTRAVNPAGA